MKVAKKAEQHSAIEVTDKTFEEEVLNFPGLVILDIYGKNCGPCRVMGPILEEIASENKNDKVKVVKLEAGESKIAREHKIRAVPTIVVYYNGKEIERHVGLKEKWFLEKIIEDNT